MRKLLVLSVLASAACSSGISDAPSRSRVALSFASVLGGDFVSVLDTAHLSISAGGKTQAHTKVFGSGDSEVSFDVTVPSGEATFDFDIRSTNGAVLYQGRTTSTIDADDFVVTLTTEASNAVLVVAPARASYVLTDNLQIRTFSATLRIKNPGAANLTWRVDSLVTKPTQVTMFCTDFNDNDCRTNQTRAPGPELTIGVGFSMPSGFPFTPPATLRFISSVGNVTTRP